MAARAEKRFAHMPQTANYIRLPKIYDESLRAPIDAAQELKTLFGADEAVAALTTGRLPLPVRARALAGEPSSQRPCRQSPPGP